MADPLSSFIAGVRRGVVRVGTGGISGGALVDSVSALRPDDVDAVTAEAYNQGVLSPDVPWERGRDLVRAGLSGQVPS